MTVEVFQGAYDFAGGGAYGEKDHPRTKEQADYNLKYLIAVALLDDQVGPAQLDPKRVQAADQEMFRHVGIEPTQVPILALKSTVHFRADFQPIAETILVVQSPGAHVSDPVEMPYRHLRPGVRLRPQGPEHR